jgi:phage/plasmid-associated DNA primase
LLTQKRGQSSAASPEIAQCRGKRFISMAEPDRGQRFNIGLMKELTGGDKIPCRPLYKEPFLFKPQFKIVLCCNDLPKVPPDDEGSWRRIRVVHFISKFTKQPKKQYEFKIDPFLADKFDRWKEAFMYLLLNKYYKEYAADGIDEPPEVTQATREYQKMSDIFVDYLDEYIGVGTEDDYIKIDDMYFRFKNWYTTNHNPKVPSKIEFKGQIEKKLGTYPERGWKGYRLKTKHNEDRFLSKDDTGNSVMTEEMRAKQKYEMEQDEKPENSWKSRAEANDKTQEINTEKTDSSEPVIISEEDSNEDSRKPMAKSLHGIRIKLKGDSKPKKNFFNDVSSDMEASDYTSEHGD